MRPPLSDMVSSDADDVETSPSVTVVTATKTILPPRGAQAGSEYATEVETRLAAALPPAAVIAAATSAGATAPPHRSRLLRDERTAKE